MRATFVVLALMICSTPIAQATDKKQTTERAMIAAQCVRAAIKESATLLSPVRPGDHASEVRRAQIRKELDAMNLQASDGVQKCLSKQEVYELGWFSYLQDATSLVECDLHPTAALESHRDEDDADGDLINGSTKWEPIQFDGERDGHPFFSGQAAARAKFADGVRAHDYRAACADLIAGFSDNGDRFPGLVSTHSSTPASRAGELPPTEGELRFAELYREFQLFRQSPKFKTCGFAQCGFPDWMNGVQALIADRALGFALIERCEHVPGDLMTLGIKSIPSKATHRSAADSHYLKTTDAQMQRCAEKIEGAASRWTSSRKQPFAGTR